MIVTSTSVSTEFYVVGGTMRHDARSYVERRADKELFDALLRREFCYVLTARQMGKSSLMIRTAVRLRDAEIGVAMLDLTSVGQNLTVEQWYGGLLVQMGQRLKLEDELIEFWMTHPLLGPMQRWVNAVRTVVLPYYSNGLVIFIDEIDAVRSLPFSTDEFFAGIRECYNQRTEDLEIQRVAFCLSGVATPSDLIRNARTTPFNVGRRIVLHDFTEAEAAPLADGLQRGSKHGATLLKRVLHWTGGHPYLTQRLCQAVAADITIQGDADVDRLCEELFFSRRAREQDDNLLFVRECILSSGAELGGLLDLYTRVRKNKPVSDDEANPLVSVLRLSGITRSEDGRLRVRNRIYSRVFDSRWVAVNIPDAEVRRQRAAYRRGIWRTAAVSALFLAMVGWIAFAAIEQGKRDRREAALNRLLLGYTELRSTPQELQDLSAQEMEQRLAATIYHAQIKQALEEWNNSNPNRVKELLQESTPRPGQADWRSFEWYWLSRVSSSERIGLQVDGLVASATFLPDGKTLAIGEAQRAKGKGRAEYFIKLYDWETGDIKASFPTPAGDHFDLAIFSPDKQTVATDGPNFDIILRDVYSGRVIAKLEGHQDGITAMAFSPDGKYMASGDFRNVAKVWDIDTGKERAALTRLKRWVRHITFSPDGRLIATTDESDVVRIWAADTGRELQPFTIKGSPLSRAFFSPDGKRLITAVSDGRLHIWDVRTRQIIATLLGHAGETRSLAFSPDGKTMATGSVDRTIKLWDTQEWNELATIRAHGSAVNSVAFSVDGKHLVSGSPDGTIKIWDTSESHGLAIASGLVAKYFAASFSPEGDLLALGVTKDSRVKVWNLSTGQEIAGINEAEINILYATFSRDGKLLATGGLDRLAKIWDVATGRQIHELKSHQNFIYSLDFSPDGKLLISGGEDRALKIWDITSGQEIASLNSDAGNSSRAIFSPDSKMVASACRDGSVILWDVASGTVIHTLTGHTDVAVAMAFSHDGRHLATAGRDNVVRLWDRATGQELAKLSQVDSVKRIAFSLDGRRLVTGGGDGSVKLWDLTTRHELITFKAHLDKVSSVTFSPDGRSLATTSNNGSVRLWRGATEGVSR